MLYDSDSNNVFIAKRIYASTSKFVYSEMIPKDIMIAQIVPASEFRDEQIRLKSSYPEENQRKICIRDMEELLTATCLRLRDNEGKVAGHVAVSKTGEIISLLKNYDSKVSHFMNHAFANAIMVGGNNLDCYNCDSLGPSYCKRGFIPICKIRFSHYVDTYNMSAVYGEPDIIFYFYCGDPISTYYRKVNNMEYMSLDRYRAAKVPYISEIQDMIGYATDSTDYMFAHTFRNMVMGLWTGRLKAEYWYRPNKLINYIMSDPQKLKKWMDDYI